jgi:hypothetical protein
MTNSEHIDDIKEKRLCFGCVGETYLRYTIRRDGKSAICSYCGKKRKGISIEEMSDRIDAAFERHFRRTSIGPSSLEYMMIKEGDYDWEREGEPVVWAIAGAADIAEAPATDVQRVLEARHADMEYAKMGEECAFDADSYYEEIGPNDIEFREDWWSFTHSLKTEARFFNRAAEATLATVFEGLVDHETRDGRRVIVQAGPGEALSTLYRARIFESNEPLEDALKRPDLGIGPPPADVAAAGRMNARGISVFYGAVDPMIALAEIRPPVGSRVVIGSFEVIRPVRLLDVAALESVFVKGSIFHGGYIRSLERAKFLGTLSRRITMPVMPNDEPSDYLVTQAIADYLATQVKLDGIVYPSAQGGEAKQNVVLFHGAARVEEMEIPANTEISARLYESTEEGPEIDYSVWEEVPPSPAPAEIEADPYASLPVFRPASSSRDRDVRENTLRLHVDSIEVHHVSSVSFVTQAYPVSRHRWEKREPPF